PEMSAPEVAARVAGAAPDGYAFVIVNFANPDMVGHTGSIPAAIAAVETTDRCLGEGLAAIEGGGGVGVGTADPGEGEAMLEADGVSPHTAHTTNPVPLVVTDAGVTLREGGELSDLAPTILAMLGISPPGEMTGLTLVNLP